MIRFINCVRRRKDISIEEFRRYWNSPEFDYLFEKLFVIVEPRRFAKNLTLQVSANEQIRQERGSGEPFDGTLEYWWHDARELLEKYDSPQAQKVRQEMLEYQQQFIDLVNCRAFFTEYVTKEFID
ncbi:hypothetical protein [Kaarinaea lacus]